MENSEPSFLVLTVAVGFFLGETGYFVCRTHGLTPSFLTVALISVIAGLLLGILLDWLSDGDPDGRLYALRSSMRLRRR
jgi:NhaP-type Na+/H+ or K+/H+ antiporter